MREAKLVTLDEILKKVNEKKLEGQKNEKWFFNSHLTKLDADVLERVGYKVKACSVGKRPNFRISW